MGRGAGFGDYVDGVNYFSVRLHVNILTDTTCLVTITLTKGQIKHVYTNVASNNCIHCNSNE